MDISSATREQIAAEAIEWFLYFQNSDGHAKDHQALSEWLTRSPVHIEEYLAVSTTWAGLTVLNDGEFTTDALIAAARATNEPGNVCELKTHFVPLPLSQAKPRNRPYWIGIAASLVVCFGIWFGVNRWYPPNIRTAIGEQRSVTLSDGSVVILNTDSEVRVRWTDTERRIELVKGEGQFHVAKNPRRPFVVATTDASVRAVGTVFNVRNAPSGTQVAVLEGRVNVSAMSSMIKSPLKEIAGAGPTIPKVPAVPAALKNYELSAGQRVTITVQGIEPDIGPSVEAVEAWTQRRLVFRDQRLDDVVAEFNRYRVQLLVIDDAELKSLRISGVFDLSDPESLLVYLKSYETVNVGQHGDSLHLSRDVNKFTAQK